MKKCYWKFNFEVNGQSVYVAHWEFGDIKILRAVQNIAFMLPKYFLLYQIASKISILQQKEKRERKRKRDF